MKILHINSYYSGGKFYKNLYDKQIEKGLDIDVYVPISTALDPSKVRNDDYSIISQNHGKYDRIFFHLKHKKIYNDVIKKFKIGEYSLIHAHSLFSNGYIAYKLKQNYNIPYIVAVRNSDVNVFFKNMIHLRKMGINILRNAEKIIFLSQPYKEYIIDRYVPDKYRDEIYSKSLVIPNGIDNFWFENEIVEREEPDKDNLNIIYVGDINSNKNIETTTKACQILLDQGYKVKYKVIGKIKDNKYKDFIENHPFIHYVPYCTKEELINHYRNGHIFVMPSKHETFGLVYAEAMSQGLPIIYTRGQGFDGQFKEGIIGYSVQYDSEEEIVKRIKDILDQYKNISSNCKHMVNKFNWTDISKEYEAIYKEIEGV